VNVGFPPILLKKSLARLLAAIFEPGRSDQQLFISLLEHGTNSSFTVYRLRDFFNNIRSSETLARGLEHEALGQAQGDHLLGRFLTRMSSARTPSTAAGAARASAPCRTSARDQRPRRPLRR
jgi:hypothetical protein